MEVTLKDPHSESRKTEHLVSILVLMEVTLKEQAGAQDIALDKVSILVLMEVTLKDIFGSALVQHAESFNPCFNGSDSKRKKMDA